MNGALGARIAARLQQDENARVITVLQRRTPPHHLTGSDLLLGAQAAQEGWRRAFGPGPLRLVLALPPGKFFLTSLLGGMLGGHSIIPVALPRLGSVSERLSHVVQDCHADAVLCTLSQLPAIRQRLVLAEAGPPCALMPVDGPQDAVEPGKARFADRDRRAELPAVIQYTSGSTRRPKGVRIHGDQILANSELVHSCWGMEPSTPLVNWLPHYHDMGLMGGILYPLLAGSHSVQMNPLDIIRSPVEWLRAISEYRAVFSGGPAFGFADCLERVTDAECEGLDLSSWTRAYCGAEPIPAGLLPAFERRFAASGLAKGSVFGCYGMAEITLFAAGAPEETALPKPPEGCAAVHPCRVTEATRPLIRLVDPATRRPVPDGKTGEIWLQGPSMGRGYLNLPEETSATFQAALAGDQADRINWLRTGDVGVLSGEFLYVTGRIKDTLIVNGRKISAAEIEWLAASADAALNPLAAAAFTLDPVNSAAAVLMIELRKGRPAPENSASIQSAIARMLAGEWGIRLHELHILPRGRLMRTSSGKIRRQVVAETYRQIRLQNAGSADATEEDA